MAIKIFDKFSPRANPADGNYPYGSIKNESVPGAKDGTPLDAVWGNDYAGFDAALLAEAGIVPSGNADTAVASQRLEALKTLIPKVGDTIYSRVFTSVVGMANYSGHAIGNSYKVNNGSNSTEYKVVTAPSDVDLGGGLYAKNVDAKSKNIDLAPVTSVFAGMTTAANGAGNISGSVEYNVTFYTSDGETSRVGLSNPIAVTNNSVLVTDIPIATDTRVIGRRLYRNVQSASDVVLKQLVVDIADNTTTQYNDNIADGSLGARLPWNNTTGGMLDINGERHFISNDNSLYIGSNASVNNTNYANVGIGPDSLRASESSIRCTAVGVLSLPTLVSGTSNGAFGVHAGQSLIAGSNNNFFGYSTSFNLEIGSDNTIIGDEAGRSMGLGFAQGDVSKHTVVGSRAMHEFIGSATPNRPNTVMGYRSLFENDFGVGNLMLGSYAGGYGSWNNTIILDTIDRGDNNGIVANSPFILTMGATPSDQALKLNARLRSANADFYVGVDATNAGLEMNQVGEFVYSTGLSTATANPNVFFSGGNLVGTITVQNGNETLFSNLSDKNAKTNIAPAESAIDRTLKLEVMQHDWKTNDTHVNYSFIAQKLHETNANAVVVGGSDADYESSVANKDNEYSYWGVDNAKLVPQLTKAIQELIEIVRGHEEILKDLSRS